MCNTTVRRNFLTILLFSIGIKKLVLQLPKEYLTFKKRGTAMSRLNVQVLRIPYVNGCGNNSPTLYGDRYAILVYVCEASYALHIQDEDITLLSFLICLGWVFPNPNAEVMKSCDNHLCSNRFICSLCKIGILRFHTPAFSLGWIGCRMFCRSLLNCSLNHLAMGFRSMAGTNLVPPVELFTT